MSDDATTARLNGAVGMAVFLGACAMLFAELEEQYPNIAQAIKSTASIVRRGERA